MISAIFAIDENNGMGYNGKLPWPKIQEDLSFFKQKTNNEIVVMGKNTWNSPDMPTPLPNRLNIVCSNTDIDNVITLSGDIRKGILLLHKSNPHKIIFIIGGMNILMQTAPIIDKVYVSKIHGSYPADVIFPSEEFFKHFIVNKITHYTHHTLEEYTKHA